MTARRHWSDALVRIGACDDAVTWARTQPSLAVAWMVCDRGDWMLWWAGKHSGKPGSAVRKRLTLCACDCAELSAHLATPDGQVAIALCLTIARDWASGGDSTQDDVIAAADAAYAAADAAYAAYAAYAAADAAYAAYAAADARSRVLSKCAKLVRSHYPRAPRGVS